MEIHDGYEIHYLDEEQVELLDEVGHGRFSNVYRAKLNDTLVAAKKLKPIEPWRVKREVRFMTALKDAPNVVKLHGVYGDELSPIIVTEFVARDENTNISYEDLQWIMRELLMALNATHYEHIFHRDIKWQNLLVSFKERRLRIIDWGLAEFFIRGRRYSPSAGTKSYKAPELLLGCRQYGPAVDVWAAGIIMANLMFGCPSFFNAGDVQGVLARHTQFFGPRRMRRLAKMCGYRRPLLQTGGQSFLELALPHTRHLIKKEAIDLLQELLTPEPNLRITAADALLHPFLK